jgi:hypothetical protein
VKHALAGFIRVVGAFQVGVGVYLIPPGLPGSVPLGVLFGVLAFWWNRRLDNLPDAQAVVVRGYVVPLSFPALLYLLLAIPTSWAALGYWAEEFLVGVFSLTPPWVYLAGLAYGSFRASSPPRGTDQADPFARRLP